MQVSLRRATELSEALEYANPVVDGGRLLSIYEPDVEAKVATERVEVLSSVALADRLASIGCQLRKEVARQEAAVGINDLLADQERLSRQQHRLKALARHRPWRAEIVRGRIEKIQQTRHVALSTHSERHHSANDELAVDVLTSGDLADFTRQLVDVQHQLHGIEELLNDLNQKTTVNLADADAALLREQGLI